MSLIIEFLFLLSSAIFLVTVFILVNPFFMRFKVYVNKVYSIKTKKTIITTENINEETQVSYTNTNL